MEEQLEFWLYLNKSSQEFKDLNETWVKLNKSNAFLGYSFGDSQGGIDWSQEHPLSQGLSVKAVFSQSQNVCFGRENADDDNLPISQDDKQNDENDNYENLSDRQADIIAQQTDSKTQLETPIKNKERFESHLDFNDEFQTSVMQISSSNSITEDKTINQLKSDLNSNIFQANSLIDPSKINSFLLKYYIENEIKKKGLTKFCSEIPSETPFTSYGLNSESHSEMENVPWGGNLSETMNPKIKAPIKIPKLITNWEHVSRKHYAKGMWSICYHRQGRTKLATKWPHTDQPNYAKGWWQTWYLSIYYNEKKKK